MTDANPTAAVSTVREIPPDKDREPEAGLAVCLSGGGYRAMVFHIGVLWRLNEVGLLPEVKRFSSVSGGSLSAGVLAMNWGNLAFDDRNVASNFNELVVIPLRKMAGTRVDLPAVVAGSLLPGASISDRIAAAYRRHLFGAATLQDLPDDPPRFVFNATNLTTGVLMRFSKPYLGDYKIGRILKPDVELAVVVAASSAFPPILSPCTLHFKGQQWVKEAGNDPNLDKPEFRDKVELTDGGVYDNLGLEPAWKKYMSVLVSDAGGILAYESDPSNDWIRQTYRVLKIIDNQVRSLRKRQIVGSFRAGERNGMYVGIWSDLAEFPQAALPVDHRMTLELAKIPTRLDALDDRLQERLINWGYSVCDAGLRSYYLRAKLRDAPATALPYPARPLT
jgi:NTE family protein